MTEDNIKEDFEGVNIDATKFHGVKIEYRADQNEICAAKCAEKCR
ncbi:MAG: hypothetical protein SOX20_08195 [Parolsenella sp.]|nr:hypothetical protein [Parolsenella sp.]MDY3292884.1 hypothetical protein [Parolsenella sp.]